MTLQRPAAVKKAVQIPVPGASSVPESGCCPASPGKQALQLVGPWHDSSGPQQEPQQHALLPQGPVPGEGAFHRGSESSWCAPCAPQLPSRPAAPSPGTSGVANDSFCRSPVTEPTPGGFCSPLSVRDRKDVYGLCPRERLSRGVRW